MLPEAFMPEIQKISIAVTSEQLNSIKTAVDAGEYATTSEVVREALREWQRQRELRGEELNRLRALWQQGKASGQASELDTDSTLAEARRRLDQAARQIA
jgi:antitoxin ParD1/3/4